MSHCCYKHVRYNCTECEGTETYKPGWDDPRKAMAKLTDRYGDARVAEVAQLISKVTAEVSIEHLEKVLKAIRDE